MTILESGRMIQPNWTALLGKLATTSSASTKRTPLGKNRFGLETEQLENRALLSATAMQDESLAPAALVGAAVPRKVNVPQNVAGTWDLTGTGAGVLKSVGTQTGSAVFTQQGSTVVMTLSVAGLEAKATITLPLKGSKASANVNIPGLGEFPATGTASKNKLSLTGKTEIDGKKVTIKLDLKFASGATPKSFTGTIKVGGKTVFKFEGDKQ